MANYSEFYRGKRKKTAPWVTALLILLAVAVFAVMLFYGMEKYIVISSSGLSLELPILDDGRSRYEFTSDAEAPQVSFAPVSAELEVGEADYSNIKAVAGEGLAPVKLAYVPASDVTASGVAKYVGADGATGVLLDVKTVTGMLVWDSQSDVARGYGTNGTTDLKSIVASLKEQGQYVAVRMCCFVDNALASRFSQLALKTTAGLPYSDSNGAWVDPTNATVRGYMLSLCSELSGMGVDEIVLTGMRLPSETGVEYAFSSNSAVKPTPETAISGFAISITRAMRGTNTAISCQINSSTAMETGLDSVTGLNAETIFKLFDRVYYSVSADEAPAAVETAANYVTVGDVKMRVVPVCSEAPETDCWLLIK